MFKKLYANDDDEAGIQKKFDRLMNEGGATEPTEKLLEKQSELNNS